MGDPNIDIRADCWFRGWWVSYSIVMSPLEKQNLIHQEGPFFLWFCGNSYDESNHSVVLKGVRYEFQASNILHQLNQGCYVSKPVSQMSIYYILHYRIWMTIVAQLWFTCCQYDSLPSTRSKAWWYQEQKATSFQLVAWRNYYNYHPHDF